MSKLYDEIVKDVLADAADTDDSEIEDDEYVDVVSVSDKAIEFYDRRDGFDYHYILTNPDLINKDWVMERLIFTRSCEEKLPIDRGELASWIAKIPASMLMTVSRIVFIYDDEADWDELFEDERIGNLLEEQNFPDDGQLGITWATANICIVHVRNIVEGTQKLFETGQLYAWEKAGCINEGILTTIAHEIRHIAQNNPYLPENVLGQSPDDSDEDDAEAFAQNFLEEHSAYCLLDV